MAVLTWSFSPGASRTDPPHELNHEVVLSDSIKVALPAGHPLARKKLVLLKELSNEPQIVAAHDRHGSLISHQIFQRAGLSMHPRHVIDHPQTTLALVAAGAGVSLVPASCENVARPDFVYRPIRPTGKVKLIAAWKQDDHAPVLRAFVETLKQIIKKKSDTALKRAANAKVGKRANSGR